LTYYFFRNCCEIIITEDSIILKLPEKVQFCARKALKDSRPTTNGQGDFGVYATAPFWGQIPSGLLVPTVRKMPKSTSWFQAGSEPFQVWGRAAPLS